MKRYIILFVFILMLLPSLSYGDVLQVCGLEEKVKGINVVTPDVKDYLIVRSRNPCDYLKKGLRVEARKMLGDYISLIESYVGREMTRAEADGLIAHIRQLQMGI